MSQLNRPVICSVKKYFSSFYDALSIDFASSDHNLMLSIAMKKDYINYLKQSIAKIEIFLNSYFKSVFSVRNKLLQNLKPLRYEENFLEIPFYKHDTKTGRSRVVSGTNYLTMKKEKREKLKPSNDRILDEVDFSSCEPSFYFLAMGCKIKNDLYESIKQELDIDVDRKKLKLAIISILYGAGYDVVKKTTKLSNSEYEKIKNHMQIDAFKSKYLNENSDMYYNYYGRPILNCNEKSKVNSWVQSSAVDFAYLCFYEYAKTIKTIQIHAVIHDAMLFSIEKLHENQVKNVTALSEDISNFKIPVKIRKISDN